MPLIAYQRAHGATDYPHHFAFFEALEQRGLLDKYDFVLDTFMAPGYCRLLVDRFPQLSLGVDQSVGRKSVEFLKNHIGRGYQYVAYLDKFDAVCESPGGRINPIYSGGISNFWLYPRVKRRAILFHSVEEGIKNQPRTAASIAECELIVTRTDASARICEELGAKRIIRSCDVVFRRRYPTSKVKSGNAVALRLPNHGVTPEYLNMIRSILDYFENSGKAFDLVRVEQPVGSEMDRRGYSSDYFHNISMYQDDYMYEPFKAVRDAVVSCRLHTTILALLHGNLNILQFHVESGTTKLQQFVDDLGLQSLPVLGANDLTLERIRTFVENPKPIPREEAENAIEIARRKVEHGFDEIEQWLGTI